MLELLEPECEAELVALALQHLAKGWVATEENCDLSEKMFKLFLSQVDCLCLWGVDVSPCQSSAL